jgi:hypothetical protein
VMSAIREQVRTERNLSNPTANQNTDVQIELGRSTGHIGRKRRRVRYREHLASIVAIEKVSRTPKDFFENVNKVHVRYGQTLPLFESVDQPHSLITDSSPIESPQL